MDHGEELGVDLVQLWELATLDLPEIAKRWADANAELYGHGADRGLFERQAPVPGVIVAGHELNAITVGRVYPHFDDLRDAIQDVMYESTKNVYEAVDALIEIMNNYADSDGAAKERLERSYAYHTREYGPQPPFVHEAE